MISPCGSTPSDLTAIVLYLLFFFFFFSCMWIIMLHCVPSISLKWDCMGFSSDGKIGVGTSCHFDVVVLIYKVAVL